jgi:hypothetical protein
MFRHLVEVPRLLVIGGVLVLVALLRARPARPLARARHVPRVVAAAAVLCTLASGTIAFAAGRPTTQPVAYPSAAAPTVSVLVVPDVRGQAYVFAKGMLEDAGFAWRAEGDVGGYAANSVVLQTPPPAARVFDTGFPTVTLGLERNASYAEAGAPENRSPYAGTPIESVGETSASTEGSRLPAFVVSGAPKESTHQPSLPERARRLAAWLETHRTPTRANVAHWRYEHAWIVTGARLGWWRGAEALETLVKVDRRAERLWDRGTKRRLAAKRALAHVRAEAR